MSATTTARAYALLPLPPRDGPDIVIEGLELTDEQQDATNIEEQFIPSAYGAPDIRIVITRPRIATGNLPVLLHFHGGAFCIMSPESFAGMEAGWAIAHQCTVVSVDYRLAPEHPFPAGLEDCYSALAWVANHAIELEVDIDRLVVTGASAGGALTAAVAQMARDKQGPKISYQALMIPVTDDRLRTPSYHDSADAEGFNKAATEGMWLHYLGADYDRANTSPYAAPLRAGDFSNLPPAFIQTNGLDPLRDEGLEYGMALLAAGIEVEIYNCPGAYHGAPPKDFRTAGIASRVYNAALGAHLNPDAPTAGV